MKQNKYREKKDFDNMLNAMKHEDDIRRNLRNDSLRFNKSQLEKQIAANQKKKVEESKQINSYSSGVKFMDHKEAEKQKHTFSHFGPDDSPERLTYFTQKKENQQSLIRETLTKQMEDNKNRKRAEKDQDDAYGQKLSHMAMLMQRQEHERHKKQRELHF